MKTASFWAGRAYAGGFPVSTARSQPRGFNLPALPKLAPAAWLLRAYKDGEIDAGYYTACYDEQLAGLDAAGIVSYLHAFADGLEPVLCCWESAGLFCHRRLVAEWLQRQLDIEVPELTP